MSESATKKMDLTPYKVWGILLVLTLIYGVVLTFVNLGDASFVDAIWTNGLWRIITNPALLTHDYVAMVGVGPAFVNVALSGLLMIGAFKFAKLPGSGPQMGVLGLVMGFAFLGKNPANMLPILLGALMYSAFTKKAGESLRDTYKGHVTFAGFSTCLAPIVSQAAFLSVGGTEINTTLGVLLGVFMGLVIGFVINAMAVFIRKSHEGLNLYNIGWGAGLIAIALSAVYRMIGVDAFGPGVTRGYVLGGQAYDAYGNLYALSGVGYYDMYLYAYLAGVTVFFLAMGFLAGGKINKETFYLKAGDSKFINNMYAKYGQGPVYLAMGLLGIMSLVILLGLGGFGAGGEGFGIYLTGPVLGAILSMIGWGGFGKAVANAFAIIVGVIAGALVQYFVDPRFFRAEETVGIFTFFTTQGVIWTSAFWGTCLSPMARFFGWKWAIPIGMLHFAFAATIAPFHMGQNLYNNGLAAGFVCVVMIPIIRALDKKGKYAMEKVYPDPQ